MTIRPAFLAAAAALALVGCGAGSSTRAEMPTGWVTTPLTHYGEPASVTHPAAWRFLPNHHPGQGPGWTFGYLTTEPDHGGCYTTHYRSNNTVGVVCHGPVRILRPGGVLVRLRGSIAFSGPLQFAGNATVDGRSAQIDSGDLAACPAGSTGAERLQTQLEQPNASPPDGGYGFSIQICFNARGTSENLAAEADQMIRGIQFG